MLYIAVGQSKFNITSPWSDEENPLSGSRLIENEWLYLGSKLEGDTILIDFVSIYGFSKISRWHVSTAGEYMLRENVDPSKVTLLQNPSYTHTNSMENISEFGKRGANDFQIYCAIMFLMRVPAAAMRFMNSFAPGDVLKPKAEGGIKSPHIKIHLNIIFNHNYARNIPRLEKIYSGRLSRISYTLPNIAPKSPRCHSFPAGSFEYHNLIYYSIDRILKKRRVPDNIWHFFVQDDVYINKNFSESRASEFLELKEDASSIFYRDINSVKWRENPKWAWNERVSNKIESQGNATIGNGFEGFQPLIDEENLVVGTGDIFAVRGKYLRLFSNILGNFISQGIFPEVSIPSALKLLASISETSIGTFRGEYLWGEERGKLCSDYINEIDVTSRLFLHPVKLHLMK